MAMINFEIGTREFLKLRKFVKSIGPRVLRKHKIKFFFNTDVIFLNFPEGSYKLVASSDAIGTAMVPGATLVALLNIMPDNDTISGFLKNEELVIGSTQIHNQEIILKLGVGKKEISLPVNPTFKDILALRYKHSREEIEDWGMDNELQKAEAKFEEVLERVGELMSPYLPTIETISSLKNLVIKELTKD